MTRGEHGVIHVGDLMDDSRRSLELSLEGGPFPRVHAYVTRTLADDRPQRHYLGRLYGEKLRAVAKAFADAVEALDAELAGPSPPPPARPATPRRGHHGSEVRAPGSVPASFAAVMRKGTT